MSVRRMMAMFCLAGTLLAAGGPGPSSGSGGGGSSTPQVSLHIPNETAPPGGLAQMKFMVTEPTPISTGGPSLAFAAATFDAVWGIELFSPTGDVNGVATVNGSRINI